MTVNYYGIIITFGFPDLILAFVLGGGSVAVIAMFLYLRHLRKGSLRD